ncbi:MAG: alpha-E domain-containing protein [Alphaproteobacteria bacterium]
MPSLLSRFAGNAFWLGRYMERAENLARILDTNETYAREEPTGPDWRRVLDLYADGARFMTSHARVEERDVLHFYVLDTANPGSILSAVMAARQNARTIRHLISTEMWTHLNVFHSRLSRLTRRDVRADNLARVCWDTKLGCQTFEGIAEGTFQRDEPWCFYHLGKYLERADQTTRVLDMGCKWLGEAADDALAPVKRDVLVRSLSGYHAFRSRYPTASGLDDIARFLLHDEQFPRAVRLCINRMSDRLRDLANRHGADAVEIADSARMHLQFTLETGAGGRTTPAALHRFLDGLQARLDGVSDSIAVAFFARA